MDETIIWSKTVWPKMSFSRHMAELVIWPKQSFALTDHLVEKAVWPKWSFVRTGHLIETGHTTENII